MTIATNLGFPRIGARRELKTALEAFWRGDTDRSDLLSTGAELRTRHWALQRDAGIDLLPSNDFSFYDQMLDTAAMLGVVPSRFGHEGGPVPLETVFDMARGTRTAPALEMTKWFDTNYHYIVPELSADQRFALSTETPFEAYEEAAAMGVRTRPVLIGPVTFLSLSKGGSTPPLSRLHDVLPVYAAVIERLVASGASWIQMDEPVLATDLDDQQRAAFRSAYDALSSCGAQLMLTSCFGSLGDDAVLACDLPVAGLHLDLVRGPDQLQSLLAITGEKTLSLGLVDGRNVWRTDLDRALTAVDVAVAELGRDRVQLAPSCSLLHVPVDLTTETDLDPELRGWLAFGRQKLEEVAALSRASDGGREAVAEAFAASAEAIRSRRTSPRTKDAAVRSRLSGLSAADVRRPSPYHHRREVQRERLRLPPLPTTTIGSLPQTDDVRRARAENRRGTLNDAAYDAFLRERTRHAISEQEALGLDVLVHGEFERNDMVEHFGERLSGFAFTKRGWVQSYGSRCVKPPILYGDVSRPAPMTVDWSAYAQSLTERPVKGMLTGPVTILQWSFVRDDQPRADTARQIALAVRDEVADLDAAGLKAIQVDEPALREGLPLRSAERPDYLSWATEAFRLAVGVAGDATQVHTHMCYAEFSDIMDAIEALDADVISLEAARSGMGVLKDAELSGAVHEVGPGVWDIHSPRVPSAEEMARLLREATRIIPPDRLWVNPDCGLKTRSWEEVRPALAAMVDAAKTLRTGP